ncbi:unnamed protein product [Pieris brassicae]|uniref:Uncharacterized protein n=1 Tax=Pieris brassicae TaxID=7116 RepID=A0A9P0TLR7_PIEBR|nr:unnamed protein product [Pieris brassicae]
MPRESCEADSHEKEPTAYVKLSVKLLLKHLHKSRFTTTKSNSLIMSAAVTPLTPVKYGPTDLGHIFMHRVFLGGNKISGAIGASNAVLVPI